MYQEIVFCSSKVDLTHVVFMLMSSVLWSWFQH